MTKVIYGLYYFIDLMTLYIAFGLHKASKQILKYGDVLPWHVHGVVSESFMCRWRAEHGLYASEMEYNAKANLR